MKWPQLGAADVFTTLFAEVGEDKCAQRYSQRKGVRFHPEPVSLPSHRLRSNWTPPHLHLGSGRDASSRDSPFLPSFAFGSIR
jgi:hypothetical protein